MGNTNVKDSKKVCLFLFRAKSSRKVEIKFYRTLPVLSCYISIARYIYIS